MSATSRLPVPATPQRTPLVTKPAPQQHAVPPSAPQSVASSSKSSQEKSSEKHLTANNPAQLAPPVRSEVPAKGTSNGMVRGKVVQQVLPDAPQKARDTIRGKVRLSVKVNSRRIRQRNSSNPRGSRPKPIFCRPHTSSRPTLEICSCQNRRPQRHKPMAPILRNRSCHHHRPSQANRPLAPFRRMTDCLTQTTVRSRHGNLPKNRPERLRVRRLRAIAGARCISSRGVRCRRNRICRVRFSMLRTSIFSGRCRFRCSRGATSTKQTRRIRLP